MKKLLLIALFATPALAQDPMTAGEFEAYATGKTLSYAQGGTIFGTEQYLPGRRVMWAFEGDECQKGKWYPEGQQICFTYDHGGPPQCWTFWQGDKGLRARFAGDPEGMEYSEVGQSPKPLNCPGPDVGV
ncbi:hypothetical protein [Falsirhodobacter xinxiangensis]|uniref:hypothetical protein n=1 Tax=Falsirhodobacter xinxiangensis TaxID=2530049 RepID=UPI0010AB0B28|nr:hypothetical protein [Rhodobacter xinxiangensis]